LIDLNAASVDPLETLPGIGQVRADATVRYWGQVGPFESVEEVTNVSGIGLATYENIRELVTVCDGR
jgi:competence protein ComEA